MKIAWISDFDLSGSGYMNISVPLCNGLAKLGYETKAIGLGYQGTEHNNDFSIIPATSISETLAIAQNLFNMWHFDVMVVAIDIPIQEQIIQKIGPHNFPYIGIMPIEADPLCIDWAMVLMQMDKVFIISQFGTDEAHKAGIDAEHLQIGIDTEKWKLTTPEDRNRYRKALGIDEDTFVILTVADNQERKNLSRSMEIVSKFIHDLRKKVKYIMVTREHQFVGWKIRSFAQEPYVDINNELMIFERGLDFDTLWSLYAISDCFLLTSKAEGLGMPVLEAMSVGIPVAVTDCTALHELINSGCGFPIMFNYSYRDPFGNGRRYFASREDGFTELKIIEEEREDTKNCVKRAREYMEQRNWGITIEQLDRALKSIKEREQTQAVPNAESMPLVPKLQYGSVMDENSNPS